MTFVKKSVYALIGVLVLAVVWWVAGPWLATRCGVMSDAEMAHVFGRQAGPDCNGCKIRMDGAACDGDVGCLCTVGPGAPPNCAAVYKDWGGFTTIAHGLEDADTADEKYILHTPKPCFSQYLCIPGSTVSNKNCDFTTLWACGGFAPGVNCRPCEKGGFQLAIPINEDSCPDCPTP